MNTILCGCNTAVASKWKFHDDGRLQFQRRRQQIQWAKTTVATMADERFRMASLAAAASMADQRWHFGMTPGGTKIWLASTRVLGIWRFSGTLRR
ncbi:hypothetical protein TIFTF001_025879 [Ficus carica]|uniref:Uncharacterized protein n=1 Tax=Ficus carica TaxID=3494 RepID=A0AA88APF8_FICCA|nr:hypothetical protein TIFTF001_025879 [Ficus carica]